MRRLIAVGVALLLAVAVLTVLITPDQTDDVKALLHKNSPQVSLLCGMHIQVQTLRQEPAAASWFGVSSNTQVIALTCARLC